MATFGFIYATNPLLQNVTKIVCLCLKQGKKISDICLKQGQGMRGEAALPHPGIYLVPPLLPPGDHAELRAPIFQNRGSFHVRFQSLKRSRKAPLFEFLTKITHYLTAVKKSKKNY